MEKEVQDKKLYKYSFYKAGTRIFNQGDKGTDIYVLKNGAVTVIVDNQIIGLINTPDTIIGEMAYFLNLNRTASIEAIEDSDFIVISGEYLYETVMKKPQIGLDLLKILSARLAKTTKYATKLENEITEYRNELRKLQGKKEEAKPTFLEELVSYGFMSVDQMKKCSDELKKSEKNGKQASLSKILIEKKFITAEQLIQFLEMRQQS
jgi:CRP/FNR family cyclic AMP-dependent transcriptional regulator